MPNLERKMVSTYKASFTVEYRTLGQILKDVKYCIAQYGADALVQNYQEMYSDSSYPAIMKMEPESDERYNKRIALETKYEEIAKQRDIAEFERLKKKFGDV